MGDVVTAARNPNPTIWVHGTPAQDLAQVASYLSGDAHDQSKVQVLVDGRFYTLADMIEDHASSGPFSVGDQIIERQHNAHPKTVEEVHPGSHIVARGFTRSRIAWKNLKRYRKIGTGS